MDKAIVSIIFDDGAEACGKYIPIFQTYKMTCDLAIQCSGIVYGDTDKLNANELREIQRQGFGILCHSYGHTNMGTNDIKTGIVERELVESYKILRQYGLNVNGFVSPYNVVHTDYFDYIRNTYKYAFNFTSSSKKVPNQLGDDIYNLSRTTIDDASNTLDGIKLAIDTAVAQKGYLCLFGHDLYNRVSSARLYDVLNYLKTYINSGQLVVMNSDNAINYVFGVPMKAEAKNPIVQNIAPPFTDSKWYCNKTSTKTSSELKISYTAGESGGQYVLLTLKPTDLLRDITKPENQNVYFSAEIVCDANYDLVSTNLEGSYRDSTGAICPERVINTVSITNVNSRYELVVSPYDLAYDGQLVLIFRFSTSAPFPTASNITIRNVIVGYGTSANQSDY